MQTDKEIVEDISKTLGNVLGVAFISFVLGALASVGLYYVGINLCCSSGLGVVIFIGLTLAILAKGVE